MKNTVPLIHRDISWLSFNYRVLQEARDPSNPLYERIKFIAIYSNNLEEFFKTKLPNYKAQAAIFTLLEVYNSENLSNPDQIIENKTVLLEYLTNSNINKQEVKDNILEEFKNQDKDIRVLAYRVLLEKFNDKYADLNTHQKLVLKEFINMILFVIFV